MLYNTIGVDPADLRLNITTGVGVGYGKLHYSCYCTAIACTSSKASGGCGWQGRWRRDRGRGWGHRRDHQSTKAVWWYIWSFVGLLTIEVAGAVWVRQSLISCPPIVTTDLGFAVWCDWSIIVLNSWWDLDVPRVVSTWVTGITNDRITGLTSFMIKYVLLMQGFVEWSSFVVILCSASSHWSKLNLKWS